MRKVTRCVVPADDEPKVEAWLERRGIPFEVAPSRKPGRLIIFADFEACTDVKERVRLEEMYESLVIRLRKGESK